MPLSIQAILGATETVDMPWEVDGKPEKVHLTYKTGWLTGPVDAELREIDTQQRGLLEYVTVQISHMLTSWDLLDGRKAYGVNRESLSRLPLVFLLAVARTVNEAIAERRKASEA